MKIKQKNLPVDPWTAKAKPMTQSFIRWSMAGITTPIPYNTKSQNLQHKVLKGISHQGCKTTKPAYQYKLFITNKRGNTYKFPFSFFWILQFKSNISSACYQPEIYILHRFMSIGFIENNFHARPLDDP